MNNKILHLIMGAIGTGKSTLAKILSDKNKIEILSADEVEEQMKQNGIFDENYIEEEIVERFFHLLDERNSFILDGLNLSRSSRCLYINNAVRAGYNINIYDLGPGNNFSLQRRLKNPRDVPKERWIENAKNNRISYEKPTKSKEKITKIYTMY